MSQEDITTIGISPNKTDRVVAEAIDNLKKGEDDSLIILSTGVVLRAKSAHPNLLIRVMTKIPRPTPPVSFSSVMGRDMENPDDPDYISRVQAWQMDYSNGMLNVLIGYGTELVSVPDHLEGPHPRVGKVGKGKDAREVITQPLWLKDYQVLGLPIIPDSESWRYITWVLFIAAPTQEDTTLISTKVKGLSGVKEADVRNVENFPKSN